MKHKRAALVLLLGLVTWACPANSCECRVYRDNSPSAWKGRSKAVFSGEVVEVREATHEEKENGANFYVVRFHVEIYWKGVKEQFINVSTDLMGCGPNFRVGEKWLVYALGKFLETGCTQTRRIKDAAEDLAALGPGKIPKQREPKK